MITRVEISGFKSFTDFAVDLAPLSVIAGANASGKSNFLDALQIIKGLATGKTLEEANGRRGSAADLFTKYGLNQQAKKMSFAVELLLPLNKKEDNNDPRKDANRLRYELEISNDKHDQQHFLITEERLTVIGSNSDAWVAKYLESTVRDQFVIQPTSPGGDVMTKSFILDQESIPADFVSSFGRRDDITWLSEQTNGMYAQASAVKRYFENQHFVDLNAFENFSNFDDPSKNNSLILKELQKMVRDRPDDVPFLSRKVSSIAKEIRKIEVEVDSFNRVSVIGVNKDGAKFISPSLSEGTLRTIALSALLYSTAPQRTILLEEPENGVDPRALKKIIGILSDMVMHPDDPSAPLVQVICTTHSPIVLDLTVNDDTPQRLKAYLASTYNKSVSKDKSPQTVVTTIITPITTQIKEPISESRLERVTLGEAKRYIGYRPRKALSDA